MARLAARSGHERVGAVSIMGLLTQSDSTMLEQVMHKHEHDRRNTPGRAKGLAKEGSQEQMLSGSIGPVAGPVLETTVALSFEMICKFQ